MIILFSNVFLLLSCSQHDKEGFMNNDADLFLTCTQSLWTGTRADIDNNGGQGNFVTGDQIELLVTGEKRTSVFQLEYTGEQWSPGINRNDYGKGEFTLSALFPILDSVEEEQIRKVVALPVNQNNEEDYSAADILFARTVISTTDVSATLQFNHALHRININLKGTVPDDLTVEVRSLATGQVSLEEGTATADASEGYVWMKPFRRSEDSYSLIILPQDAKAFTSGEGLVRLTTGGKSASYIFNGNADTFEAGMQTTLNLTLKTEEGGSADLDFSNQTYWVYGVKAPDFPGKENIETYPFSQTEFDDGIWFRYNYNPDEVQFLTWKEGCGWYDCNKTFDYEGDGKMCWAAGASNLIHWWMEHNRKYIEAYDADYDTEYNNEPRPENYTRMTKENQQHSEVFNFFKSSFGNKGGWDTGGVNWFINGNSKYIYPIIKDFPGFFSGVFTKDDQIAVEIKNPSKENFNIWMKDAFKNNKAIGFSSYDFAGKNTGVHAMTIWGAEFDAEGNVEYVYFCDNNNSESEPNHASLRRFKVVYEESTIPEIKGLVANLRPLDYNNGIIPKSYPFSSLTLVDLRIDIWQKKYPHVK